jgi:hypothetical protein
MGLNLLGVVQFRFPVLDIDVRSLPLPPFLLSFAAGLTFALAASPCSTPILATLLAFASTQDTPGVGASLLFVYSLGYVAPLLVAASATVRVSLMEVHIILIVYSSSCRPASNVTVTLLSSASNTCNLQQLSGFRSRTTTSVSNTSPACIQLSEGQMVVGQKGI